MEYRRCKKNTALVPTANFPTLRNKPEKLESMLKIRESREYLVVGHTRHTSLEKKEVLDKLLNRGSH